VVVDPDIIGQDTLLDYLRTHVSNFIEGEGNKDTTPDLEKWLTDKAIEGAQHNQKFLQLEYLVLLAERLWLQTVHTYTLNLNRAKSVEFIKNTSCDLIRIFTNIR